MITTEYLYSLLPAIYRIRDHEKGEPLKALIEIIAEQAKLLEDDITQLYNNWFIETCEEWVVPYIGDLIAVKGLHSFSESSAFSQRARAANTISYRRRKGTATMLEQLAFDTTGWRSRAVEYFQLLETTQYFNHIRITNVRTTDLRKTNQLELINTPFDKAAHTAEVRNIAVNRGYYNIPNIGIHLWRIQSYFLEKCSARSALDVSDGRYFFNQTGIDMQLFNRPQTETEITSLASEINVPSPLRRRSLYDELELRRQDIVDHPSQLREALVNLREAIINKTSLTVELEDLKNAIAGGGTALFEELQLLREKLLDDTISLSEALDIIYKAITYDYNTEGIYFGSQPVIKIYVQNDEPDPFYQVFPEEILICNLNEPIIPIPEVWKRPSETKSYKSENGSTEKQLPIKVAVDPVTGRLAFPAGIIPNQVLVSYAFGFSGDIGGGSYNRRNVLLKEITKALDWHVGVSKAIPTESGKIFSSLADAILEWNNLPPGKFGMITIMDNYTYDENLTLSKIKMPQGSKLIITAANWNETDVNGIAARIIGDIDPDELRPHIKSDISVLGTPLENNSLPGEIIIDGLFVEGKLSIEGKAEDQLGSLKVFNCTLVPEFGGIKLTQSNQNLDIIISRSICGPIQINKVISSLEIVESIIAAQVKKAVNAKNINIKIEKSTIFGETDCRTIYGSNSIFTGKINAKLLQEGCMRFSFITDKSKTPRRFNCQPDLALQKPSKDSKAFIKNRLLPSFTSEIFGHFAYMQLSLACPDEIKTGAEDGSEMGTFNFLKQPQREANLRTSLDEYLRFGLNTGLIFVT